MPYSWLVRFARGDFYDAASRRVEKLHRYLSARRLLEEANGKRRNGSAKGTEPVKQGRASRGRSPPP